MNKKVLKEPSMSPPVLLAQAGPITRLIEWFIQTVLAEGKAISGHLLETKPQRLADELQLEIQISKSLIDRFKRRNDIYLE